MADELTTNVFSTIEEALDEIRRFVDIIRARIDFG